MSLPGGSVRVSWSAHPGESRQRLRLTWAEDGGPTVSPPSRRGFGSQLLERVLGSQFGARVEREFAPDGVRVCIELMLD